MPQAIGVSLWFTPDGEVRRRLRALIRDLARLHRTPVFEPHVTLLGGLPLPESEVQRRACALAAGLRAFPLRGTVVEGADEYFRRLFVRVEATETLLGAHARAREAFDAKEAPFLPHLSLLYGDRAPAAGPELLKDRAGWSFEVRSLEVVRTQGPPDAWRRLAAYPFGG